MDGTDRDERWWRPPEVDPIPGGALPSDVDLSKVWITITGELWAREPSVIERLAARVLGSPGLARALVTTPSLLLSWLIASAVIVALGVVVAVSVGGPWVAILAPALAAIGVAYAYGPGVDEAYELTRTMAVSDRMILLVRVLAVFAVNALLGVIAAGFVPAAVGVTWLWLVPMAAVAVLALAVATFARSAITGCAAGMVVWGLIVTSVRLETGSFAAVVEAALVPLYLVLLLAGAATVVVMTGSGRGGTMVWR